MKKSAAISSYPENGGKQTIVLEKACHEDERRAASVPNRLRFCHGNGVFYAGAGQAANVETFEPSLIALKYPY